MPLSSKTMMGMFLGATRKSKLSSWNAIQPSCLEDTPPRETPEYLEAICFTLVMELGLGPGCNNADNGRLFDQAALMIPCLF